MPMPRKKQIGAICHRPNQGPAQKCDPPATPDQSPRHDGDIQSKEQRAVRQFAMQDAVCPHTIDMWKAFGEISGIDVLQVEPASLIESFEMTHLSNTQGAKSVVIHAQRAV